MLANKKVFFESMIKYLDNEQLSVSILFVTRNKEETNNVYKVYKGNLTDNIGENLRQMGSTLVTKSYRNIDKRQFKPYNSINEDGCTEYLEDTELKSIKPLLDLVNGPFINLKTVNGKFLDTIWYYVIKFDDGKKELLIYKKYSKSFILTKGLSCSIILKNGNFGELKDALFKLENKADCIYFEDKMIIRVKGNFEQIFEFTKELRKNAEKAIDYIENELPFIIENMDVFKSKCMDHEIKVRKLNNIYNSKILERINPGNIQLLINEGILQNVELKTNSKGQITLSSEDPWVILKILDDDLVKSIITGINYDASVKRLIK